MINNYGIQGDKGIIRSDNSGKMMKKHPQINRTKKTMTTSRTQHLRTGKALPFISMVLALFAVFCITDTVSAAGGDPLWTFQEDGSIRPANIGTIQEARASTVDTDGSLIIVGYTDENVDTQTAPNNDDFYIVKINAAGNFVWRQLYDLANDEDWVVAVAVDGNNDVIVTGFAFNGTNHDIVTIKYAGTDGTPMWAEPHVFNSSVNGNDYPTALAMDGLNNIYIAGYSQTGTGEGDNGLLFKLSPNGPNPDKSPIWQVDFNGTESGNDRFTGVAAGVDGLAITGHSTVMHAGSRRDFDYLIMKFNYASGEIWRATYDHGTAEDLGYYVDMDTSGNVIVTGEAIASTKHVIHTKKYSAAGDGSGNGVVLWSATYSGGSPNVPTGMVVDTDGEVYITGYTHQAMDDFYTARYAADGEGGISAGNPLVWERVFHSGDSNTDVAKALAVDATGGVYVTGYTHKPATGDDDFQTIKYNKDSGNLLWQQDYDTGGATEQPVDVAVAIGIGGDGNVYVAGWTDQGVVDSDYDYFAVKYDAGLLDPPTGLTTELISETEVKLDWQDNSSAPNNEDNFCIFRCTGFNCNSVAEITCSVAPDQTTYTDYTVVAGNWYSYQVKAYRDPSDYSVSSNTASVLTVAINFPAPTWLYTFNGNDSLDDFANAIAVGSDDQPVATGVTSSSSNQFDYFTVKLDRLTGLVPASTQWPALFNDPDSQSDLGICLAIDNNDDVIVSGYASMNTPGIGNTNDIVTIKYDTDGPEIGTGYPVWQDQYAGPGSADDMAEAIDAAVDGSNNSVVVGHGRVEHDYGGGPVSNEDIYLIKYRPDYDDVNGQQLWAIDPFDGDYDDYGNAVTFDANGDVIVVGTTSNGVDDDIFINKYSGIDGTELWGNPVIFDSGYGHDGINSVAVDSAGNIYVAGYVTADTGDWDFYVNKYDGAGVPQWSNGLTYADAYQGYDEALSIAIDPIDGEIVVAGTITNVSGSLDYYVVRYRPDGSVHWDDDLDRIDNEDELTAMALSPSGEICLVGDTENDSGLHTDIMAVKYDHLGVLIGSTKFDSSYEDYSTSVTANDMGEFFIAGYAATGPLQVDDYDFLVFKFAGEELQAPANTEVTSHHTTVDLVWEENDPGIDGYFVYLKPGACTGNTFIYPDDIFAVLVAGTTEYTVEGLDYHDQTYCIGIQSFEGSESSPTAQSRLSEFEVITVPPIPVDSVTTESLGTTDVKICWHDSNDTEDSFTIQRCLGDCLPGSGVDWNEVGRIDFELTAPPELEYPAPPETCYLDTTACPAQEYSYRVQADRDNAWATAWEYPLTAITTDSTPAPGAFDIPWLTDVEAGLVWNDNTVDEDEFVVQRCDGDAAACSTFPDPPDAEVAVPPKVANNILLLNMNDANYSDDSGTGNDATAYNASIVADNDGPHTPGDILNDNAVRLNGTNAYITTPVSIDQSDTSVGVTMMAWVYPEMSDGNYRHIFSTENGGYDWGISHANSTYRVFTGENGRDTGLAVDINQWQHIAVTFIPGSGVRVYKNGGTLNAANGGTEAFVSYIDYDTSTNNLIIGRAANTTSSAYHFAGRIDEVGVFDRQLTDVEIALIQNRGIFLPDRQWYTDKTVTLDNDYTYQVFARKNNGCKGVGWDSAPAGPLSIDTTPQAPDVTVDVIHGGLIVLKWTPKTLSHTGFQINRCNGASCSPELHDDTLGPDVRDYSDSDFCYGDGTVRYQVIPLGVGTVNATIVDAILTPGIVPDPVNADATESEISLNWGYDSNDYNGFTVLRCEGTLGSCTPDTPVSGSPALQTDPSLLGWWHMDESFWNGTADEVIDSSGNNNHGTAYGNATTTAPGPVSHADHLPGHGVGTFDGLYDYVNTGVTIDQSATTSNGATFMAWINPRVNDSNYKAIMGTMNSSNNAWSVAMINNYLRIYNGVTAYNATASTLTIGQWQHIAAVFEPGVGTGVYVNGVLKNSYSDIGHLTGASFMIGRIGNYSSWWFDGQIDEVMAFARPLAETEIQDYMKNTAFSFSDTTASLDTCYTYRISSHHDNSCSDWEANAGFVDKEVCTDTAVEKPSNFTCTGLNTTEVTCSWTPETTGQTSYTLARCEGTGAACDDHDTEFVDLALPAEAADSSYLDATACDNKTYTYAIRAEKTGNPTGWPSAWTYLTTPATTIAANSPVVSLNAISESEIEVSWTDPNDDEDMMTLKRCEVDPGVIDCSLDAHFTTTLVQSAGGNDNLFHYRMDEETWVNGTADVMDVSGNNQHGTSYNGLTPSSSGQYGRAGDFDGIDDYIATPVNINQNFNSDGVTFEAWLYPTVSNSSYRFVISTENSNNDYDWGIYHQSSTWKVTTGENYRDTGLSVDLNQWQHIAAVFIPGTGVMFYKNGGTLNGGQEYLVPYIGYDSSDLAVTIGRRAYGSYYFTGKIDEVIVSDTQLTAAEIAAHHTYQVRRTDYLDNVSSCGATYFYKVYAQKGDGDCTVSNGWTKAGSSSTALPPPPSAENLDITCDSTACSLIWDDMNGSETGYVVQRCDGPITDCTNPEPDVWDAEWTGLDPDTEAFIDDTVCQEEQYSYRVYAVTPCGNTAPLDSVAPEPTDPLPAAPVLNTPALVTEVEIDLTWSYTVTSNDETGLKLERCLTPTTGCEVIESQLSPGTMSYSDFELAYNTQSCYRVAVFKDTPNSCNGGWEVWSNQECETTMIPPPTLTATPIDTTTVDLSWNDVFATETGMVVERKCITGNGTDPCDTNFAPVGTALPNTTTYSDDTACYNTEYTYQIKGVSEGLSNDGGGTWSSRVPITFTDFVPYAGVEVIIAHQSGEMDADFADIRFYDEAGDRELQYWIKEYTPSTQATVWLMTGFNNDIYLYYDNPAATSSNGTDALFTEVYDDFQGTQIDTEKWEVINDTYANQNDGLLFTSAAGESWNTAVISTATFDRADGNELYIDFTTGAHPYVRNYYFSMGWEKDQIADPNYTQLWHGVYFYGHHGSYRLSRIENGSLSVLSSLYDDLMHYEMKVVLKDNGARYYIKGGVYDDWNLFHETSSAYTGDETLRLGFHQYNHNMTIHSVKVKHASSQAGAAIDFINDVEAPPAFTHTWDGTFVQNEPPDPTTFSVGAITDLEADVVDGGVNLTWTRATTDETEFIIERDCGGGYSEISPRAAAGATSYTDDSPVLDASCSYIVTAHKAVAGCPWTSGDSNEVTVSSPSQAPVLTATSASSLMVKLEWDAVGAEDGYQLERQIVGGAWVPLVTVLASDPTEYYVCAGLNPSTEYYFRIRTYRAYGSGLFSYSAYGVDSVTTNDYPATGIDSTCEP